MLTMPSLPIETKIFGSADDAIGHGGGAGRIAGKRAFDAR